MRGNETGGQDQGYSISGSDRQNLDQSQSDMLSGFNMVVIATRNLGKVSEFAALFRERRIEVRSLADYESLPAIVEDGLTFGENALIKAKTIALKLGVPVLADDSGLCVDALGGAPGVWSARYAGEQATAAMNNAKLLRELQGQASRQFDGNGSGDGSAADRGAIANSTNHAVAGAAGAGAPADDTPFGAAVRLSAPLLSTARFVCALALYDPLRQSVLQVEGTCEGCILGVARGSGGFGYDPLFYLPELGCTMAEISLAHKNRISHRAKALQALFRQLDPQG